MLRQVQIKVSGKVQGVFYRLSTVEVARKLGITGTVRNLADGSVEIIARGEDESISKLINWCRQGPQKAVVNSVVVDESDLQPLFDGFKVI